MPTINFESHGSRGASKGGPPVAVTGVNTASIPGYGTKDRVVVISATLASTLGVAPGAYEHVGEDASGNWTYAPCTRNV